MLVHILETLESWPGFDLFLLRKKSKPTTWSLLCKKHSLLDRSVQSLTRRMVFVFQVYSSLTRSVSNLVVFLILGQIETTVTHSHLE